ncbi:MAG: sugar-binding transcriptional regulator [Melioribacteraceae bacterium]|nr:sugar-binding transcriptional regulator [Melioribacteraceae bacterium]
MGRKEELRLISKVAVLYHEEKLSQHEIAENLDLSQATISRLLKRAQKENIVRTTVSVPFGVYPEIEREIQRKYNLKEVIIADTVDDSDQEILRSIGRMTAYYLERTIKSNDVVGISSWSSTLLAMVDSMHPIQNAQHTKVIQILGGIGNPSAKQHATHLTQRFAALINGEAKFLPATGVCQSVKAKKIFLDDPFVQEALNMFNEISIALVGIGALEPSSLLASSGNTFEEKDFKQLQELGAVGDICQRFFDKNGLLIKSKLDDRVIGLSLTELKKVGRSIGVAGGKRKLKAIKAVLNGGWLNVFITDVNTAKMILNEKE